MISLSKKYLQVLPRSILTASLGALQLSSFAHATGDGIIRPFMSARSAAMGGLRYTTGLYDENFFGNPARATENPVWRTTLFDPLVEVNSGILTTLGALTKPTGSLFDKLSTATGTSNHVRVQSTFPAFYFGIGAERDTQVGFALISQTQGDVNLRKSYVLTPVVLSDIGPAVTVARRFLPDRSLSVGVTGHLQYRIAAKEGISVLSLVQGASLDLTNKIGEGAMFDFDLGSTYRLPFQWQGIEFQASAAVNNVLGGGFTNFPLRPLNSSAYPPVQPRTLALGASAKSRSLWKFTDTVLGFEVADIGNNGNGNLFRTLHFGGETNLSVLALRAGINQGYLTAGLGLNLRFFTLEATTWGEELSLVAGKMEDRRTAIRLVFQAEGSRAASAGVKTPVVTPSTDPVPPSGLPQTPDTLQTPRSPSEPGTTSGPDTLPNPLAPSVPSGRVAPGTPAPTVTPDRLTPATPSAPPIPKP